MKYKALWPFLGHLTDSRPDHLLRWYVLLISDDRERAKLVQDVVEFFPVESTFCSSLRSFEEAWGEISFLHPKRVLVLDIGEKLLPKDSERLERMVREPREDVFCILAGKGKWSFLSSIEKEGVVLDLLEEKPWEKEERVLRYIHFLGEKEKKAISLEGAKELVRLVGQDLFALEVEVQKVAAFVGEKRGIEKGDIGSVVSCSREVSIWEIAESLVWGDLKPLLDRGFSECIAPLRWQLQMGLQMACLLERRVPLADWGGYFPKVRPKKLERYALVASQKGKRFFFQKLEQLSRLECWVRDGVEEDLALWDLFRFS